MPTNTSGRSFELLAELRELHRRIETLTEDERQRVRQIQARLILDEMYQFAGLIDVDGTLLDTNRTSLDAAGMSWADAIGRPFWEGRWWAVSAETRQQLRAAVERAARGEFVRYEVDVLAGDAGREVVTCDFSLKPVADEAGNVMFLVPEGRNISAKKLAEVEIARKNSELQRLYDEVEHARDVLKTELAVRHEDLAQLAQEVTGRQRELQATLEALRESEARYRSIFENALEGVFRSTPEGRFVDVNPALVRMLGYESAEEVLALDIPRDIYIDPAERLEALAQWGDVMKGVELRLKKKNGELLIVSAYARAMRDARGVVTHYEGLMLDVTERTRAQEATARLAAIVESSADAIIGRTLDGIITSWNGGATSIYGYAREEAVGQPISILIPPDRPDELRWICSRIARGERVEPFETVRVTKDGRRIDVSLTVSPIRDARGSVVGAAAIARDITERKRTEAAMREQAALAHLGHMAAVVAHEVKNPLAGIRGALEIMGSRLPADGRDRLLVGEMLSRVDTLNQLVNDLLVFARPRELHLAPTALAPLIEGVVTLVRKDPRVARIEIGVEGGDGTIAADAELLKIVLMNLLLNAAEAMGETGRIDVAVSHAAEGPCRIIISDTGPGIPPEIRDKIFTPFFTTKRQGSGLGLSIARRIMQLHRGDIVADCPTTGGTVVTLTLPTA